MKTKLVLMLALLVTLVPLGARADSEPNDTCQDAEYASTWEYGYVSPGNSDWFYRVVPFGHTISVTMNPGYQLGTDIDLELYGPDCSTFVARSNYPGIAIEHISHLARATGIYAIRVYHYSGPGGYYDLNTTQGEVDSSCSDEAPVVAGFTADGQGLTCRLDGIGDISALVTLEISSVTTLNAPTGTVEASVDGTWIRCGIVLGSCSATGVINGNGDRSCRANVGTTGTHVRLRCRMEPNN